MVRLWVVALLLSVAFSLDASWQSVRYDDPDHFFDPPDTSPEPTERPVYTSSTGSFSQGSVVTDVSANADELRSIYLQTDGKVLGAGYSSDGTNNRFALARYTPTGLLDTTFFTSGIRTDNVGNTGAIINAMVTQTDGLSVVAGRSHTDNLDFAIARYRTDGSLDTSFFTSGVHSHTIWDNADIARALWLQTDGRIIAAGYSWLFGRYNFALARYLTDGNLDTSFKTSGKVLTIMSDNDSGALSVTMDSTLIVAAGPTSNGVDWDFAVSRYLSDGRLDTAFHSDGKGIYPVLSLDDINYSVVKDASQRYLLTGYADNGANLDHALIRLNNDGSLDTSFNTSGQSTVDVTTNQADVAYAITLQSDGKPLLGGYAYSGSANQFAMTRFSTDGTLDTSFNTSGKYKLSVASTNDKANAIVMLDANYYYLGGSSSNGSNLDFGLARFTTNGTPAQSGSLDFSFGTSGGRIDVLGGMAQPKSMALQGDGKIISCGTANSAFALVRYNPDASLDTSFCTDGSLQIEITTGDQCLAIQIQTDGAYLAGGFSTSNAGDYDFAISRILTDGSLDTTFNTSGKVVQDIGSLLLNDTLRTIFIQTDGRILVGGSMITTNIEVAMLRYQTDGTLDTSFWTSGKLQMALTTTVDFVSSYAVDDQLRILASGAANNKAATFRFVSDGSLDTSFFTTGYKVWGILGLNANIFDGVTVYSAAEGKIYAAEMRTSTASYISRINSDGSLDTSFSTSGVNSQTTVATRSGLLQDSGRFYVFGTKSSNFALLKYQTNGALDTSFNTSGIVTTVVGTGGDVGYALLKKSDGRMCGVGSVDSSNSYGIVCYQP